jgi:hypothetical protein
MSSGSVAVPPNQASSTLSHRPKRPSVLRKWWFWVGMAVLLVIVWELGSSLLIARRLSNNAVARFHQEINQGDYDAIWADADDGFRIGGTKDQLVGVLQKIHDKLGNSSSATLFNIQVNANTRGSFVVATYNSKFATGPAQERFIWKKTSNNVKLYRYDVQSKALMGN